MAEAPVTHNSNYGETVSRSNEIVLAFQPEGEHRWTAVPDGSTRHTPLRSKS